MKATRRLSVVSLFLMAITVMTAQQVKAQDEILDSAEDILENSDALEMDQIDIDGKLSASERLRKRREKLEERNRLMMEKKVEDIRVKQEIELTKKLGAAFEKNLNNLNEDKVQTVQAAPVVQPAPVAPAPIVETRIIEVPAPVEKVNKNSKIIPSLGVQNMKGSRIDLESNLALGLAAETLVMDQVSVGLGINYTTLDLTDVANDFVNSSFNTYNNGYYNVYGTGRKMSLNKLSVEATGKFFFTVENRIKPFAGVGLNYNRLNLKYEDSSTYNSNGVNFGNEGYSSSAMGAKALLGAEIDLNETVGFNLDLSYSKNITSGISKSANTVSTNPDQNRLENITKEIEESDTTAVQAGILVKF